MIILRQKLLTVCVAFGALALLASVSLALPPSPESATPAGNTVPNLPATIEMTKTVGTDPYLCADTSVITVPPETAVYYCYEVTNTSVYTLPRHQLYDDDFPGEILPDNNGEGFIYDFVPGEIINTVEMGFTAMRVVTQTITNFAIWESYVDDNLYAQDDAQATVHVRNPAVSAVLRVGAGNGCTGTSVLAGASGDAYALCLAITNTGEITLTNHAIAIPALGIDIAVASQVAPETTVLISRANAPALGTHYITGDLDMSANLTSTYTLAGISFTAGTTAAASIFELDDQDTRNYLPRIQQ